MKISLVSTDAEIAACYPVIRELRPHLPEDTFIARVRSQQQYGYLLAYRQEMDMPVAAAGFRMGQSLSWGRYLYVDDLVTLSTHRSRGHGTALLSWLESFAVEHNCEQLHLGSGFQRKDAHRFYEREGFKSVAYHFHKVLVP